MNLEPAGTGPGRNNCRTAQQEAASNPAVAVVELPQTIQIPAQLLNETEFS